MQRRRWMAGGAASLATLLLLAARYGAFEGDVAAAGPSSKTLVARAPVRPNEAANQLGAARLEAQAKAVRAQGDSAVRRVNRQRADAIRERAAARRAKERVSAGSNRLSQMVPPLPASGVSEPSVPLTAEEAKRRRDYLRDAVREQYFPVAKSCYEELLVRQPEASGKVVLSFAIVGDGDAGVIDRVELGDGTTMDDPEFTQCMRESLYTTVLERPPPGASETTVVYPIMLSP